MLVEVYQSNWRPLAVDISLEFRFNVRIASSTSTHNALAHGVILPATIE